ncbi:MAG: AAA family ATPase [Synechococcaceae cyanobacterium]|nr:AAA family ATPase [Synechococcaceae cyanobacterium]
MSAQLSLLRIRLLGEFRWSLGDHTALEPPSERLQALLAYLLLHADGPRARAEVAARLWPETSDAEARANLRRRLHELVRLMPGGERRLVVTPRTVHWLDGEDCRVDLMEFEAVWRESRQAPRMELLEQAAPLLCGELLPSCDDEWMVPLREQLRQRAITLLDELASMLTQEGQSRRGLEVAEQILRLDPLHEPAYCHLMRLHALAGDRASALKAYHLCMERLREELGVSPGAGTCALYEELLIQEDLPRLRERRATTTIDLPEVELPAPPLPLIGRAAEWQTAAAWLNGEAPRDPLPLLLLLGEPGIGKTRLLEELMAAARTAGMAIVRGRGYEAERMRPYGAWMDGFEGVGARPFLEELRTLALETEPDPTTRGRGRLFDLATQFLRSLAEARPTLVVLDDIQWLDETSLAFLHYAFRLLSPGLPIRFACAARSRELEGNPPADRLVQALTLERRALVLRLTTLSEAETTALVEAAGGGEGSAHIATGSGGNPLFALEMARADAEPDAPAPETLAHLIQGRLRDLEESTQELLRWAAALGHRFSPATLALVADCPIHRLLAAVDQLERHGIIRGVESGDGEAAYDFAHDVVRQVAYEQCSLPRRRLLHSHIAEALERLVPANPALITEVAHHADLGIDPERAGDACLRAADHCLRVFAYAEAGAFCRRGLRHCLGLPSERALALRLALLHRSVRAGVSRQEVAGLQEELQALIRQARERGLSEEETIGHEALISLNFDHGDLGAVQRYSLLAAERARSASPATAMLMLAHSGSCLAEIGREMSRAEALLLEARSMADRLGIDAIDVSFGLGCVKRYRGEPQEARQLLRRGWELARRAEDHWRECTCLLNLVCLELEARDLTAAAAQCMDLQHVAAAMGSGSEAPHAEALAALIGLLGADAEAEALLERCCGTLRTLDSPRMLAFLQTFAARWELQQGRPQQAMVRAEEALEAAQKVQNPSEIALAWAAVIAASAALGNLACARRHLEDLQAHVRGQELSALAAEGLEALRWLPAIHGQEHPAPDAPNGDGH